MTDIRSLLRLDALASGGLGVVLLALARILDEPLGLNVTFSTAVGFGLLAWAGFVAWVSYAVRAVLVADVVLLNLAWIVASAVFAIGRWGGLTDMGVAFVLAQAAVVATLTTLQMLAGRRQRVPVAA